MLTPGSDSKLLHGTIDGRGGSASKSKIAQPSQAGGSCDVGGPSRSRDRAGRGARQSGRVVGVAHLEDVALALVRLLAVGVRRLPSAYAAEIVLDCSIWAVGCRAGSCSESDGKDKSCEGLHLGVENMRTSFCVCVCGW